MSPEPPPRPATITWQGRLTALSSMAHGGETRGTITLLRRELVCLPGSDRLVHVPVISGNTLRGRLRRIGEELLRDELHYEGLLSPGAAHALRGGGSLTKSGREPLSGARLHRLRDLIPQIGLFGASGGGTIIGGAVDVGKVIPHLQETNHITGAQSTTSAFAGTQLEAYARQDESDSHDFAPALHRQGNPIDLVFDDTGRPEPTSRPGTQMQFHVETFPAGTVFSTWIRLRRPTPLEVSFLADILATFAADGRLGGRVAVGHGRVHAQFTATPSAPEPTESWRDHVRGHREEILSMVELLA